MSTARRSVSLVLMLALLAAAGSGGEPAGKGSAPAGGISTVIVIGGSPFPCRILSWDEESLTVLLEELGSTTRLQWVKISPLQRHRIRRLIGAARGEPDRPMGRKIRGVEVRMRNGMRWRGVELKERNTPARRCFRFSGVSFIALPIKDIAEVKAVEIYEGEVYTPRERYQRELAVRTPKTAEDQFRMGRWCIENELVSEAREHLTRAQLLDSAYVDRCVDLEPQLKALAAKVEARELYREFQRARSSGDLGSAVKILDTLAATYPDFEKNSDLAKGRPILVTQRDKQQRRSVITSYYRYVDHFIRELVTRKKSDTPPVVLTVITLKSGFEVVGKLKGGADGDKVVLEMDGKLYSVPREKIARIGKREVQKGPFRWPTLAECRKYVTDSKGGITTDVVAAISKDLSLEEKKVAEIWAGRLAAVHEVGDGGIKTPEFVAAYHEAHWGAGSWLREAGAGTPAPTPAPAPRPVPGPGPAPAPAPQWPDPETWWKAAPMRLKIRVLEAMCAEALMKVEKTYTENCPNCAGTGTIQHMDTGIGGGGFKERPCAVCRGTGRFWRVVYR